MTVVVAAQDGLWCCTRCRAIYRTEVAFCAVDGGEVVEVHDDPLIGIEVGQYAIEAFLGQGAMGRVYRARHRHLADRAYAVKVLHGDLAATPEMRIRFLNEAQNASKLTHPNVITVFDVGRTEGGLLYLVMELVEGEPLSALIDRGPVDPVVVATLARGICEGLAHAHAHGLVHRDLKPENILVVRGPDGDAVPRIVDFGIAVSLEQADARLTATGMSMGTPAYIAPEQLSTVAIDARVDQYALGVTLFEMLTGGELPFRGTPIEIVGAKTTKDAPRVASRMPTGVLVPPGLARIVDRMVARKPSDRYPTIEAVARTIGRWASAPRTEALPRRPIRRSHFVIAAGLAVILAGAGAFAWSRHAEDPEIAAPAPARPEALLARAPAAAPVADPAPASSAPIEIDRDSTPGPRIERRERLSPARTPKARPRVAAVAPAAAPPVAPPSPASSPAVAVAAPESLPREAPVLRTGKLQGVNVTGALSQTDVRRALARIEPSIQRCTSPSAATAIVRFTIDDSRRPRGLRGSGAAGDTLGCLLSAIGKARVEVAPDVGDAEIAVTIQFSSPS